MNLESIFEEMAQQRVWVAVVVLIALLLWELVFPYMRQGKHRVEHGLVNLAMAACNMIIGGLLFSGVWAISAFWAREQQFGVLYWVGLSPAWRVLGAVILMDFWTYWWHRWNHRIGFLWRFHQVHHSDPAMDVTTAYRFHFGEIAISSLLRIPLIALFGIHLWELVFYEMLLFVVVQFHHANISVSAGVDRALAWVIPSPYMHKIHHSRKLKELDTNFTSLFSVWDRLFGTYLMIDQPHSIRFGLPGEKKQGIKDLLTRPFEPMEN